MCLEYDGHAPETKEYGKSTIVSIVRRDMHT